MRRRAALLVDFFWTFEELAAFVGAAGVGFDFIFLLLLLAGVGAGRGFDDGAAFALGFALVAALERVVGAMAS